MSTSSKKKWWEEGVRFECQGSGKCCTSHGEYGHVFLTQEDRKRFAKHFKLTLTAFTKKFCIKYHGVWKLIDRPDSFDCIFLENKRCSAYEGRPTQCRTWPFWPDVMDAKTWKKDVVSFCPGVGKGKVVPVESIRKQMAEQTLAEEEIIEASQE